MASSDQFMVRIIAVGLGVRELACLCQLGLEKRREMEHDFIERTSQAASLATFRIALLPQPLENFMVPKALEPIGVAIHVARYSVLHPMAAGSRNFKFIHI